MPQSVTLNGATSGEVRVSADGTRIYQAGADGVVRAFDTLTGAVVTEWQVGGSLGAMDLAPGGDRLIIFDTEEPIMHYIDLLRFDTFNSIEYEVADGDSLITDIAIFSGQTALVIRSEAEDDGFGSLQLLNINLATFTGAGSVASGGILSRVSFSRTSEFSPFREDVLVSEPGIGAFVFREGLGEFRSTSSQLVDPTAQAIGGSFLALARPGFGVSIGVVDGTDSFDLRDESLGVVREIEFSSNAEFLYVLGQSGTVLFTYQTSDWSLVNSFPTGLQIADDSSDLVTLLVDPRGQFFTIETSDGFVLVENPDAPDLVGEIFPDQIRGTLFGDVIFGLEGDDTIEAGDGADFINGGTGSNRIFGGSNVDTLVVDGNFADFTITQSTVGRFQVSDGQDTNDGGSFNSITEVEFVQFDDQTVRLLRGEGVSVDFDTSDVASYQSAMSAIRDFDGNALGGIGSWLRIGEADVNGDGDIDQILVNQAIGRFATVGTAPDVLVYFDDHSWAGETRVAGTYIDPLVESGDVVAGSDSDSQRRFQNDLEIENINRVLGSDDYDGDGIQEVFFALTDGTAFLRALMHDDGNIRYANYQSEQEVVDYLTANGFDENTFGDWFGDNAGNAPAAKLAEDSGAALGAVAITDFDPVSSDIQTMFAQRPGDFAAQAFEQIPAEFFG